MNFEQVVTAVTTALSGTLPGAVAHQRMAPRPPRQWPAGFDRRTIRDAATLLLLFPVETHAHIVLTVRAETLGRHGGQVSLPGGVIDPGETREDAALREAREEIGLLTDDVRVIGTLTPLEIPVSGFRLHPVVAATSARPRFVAAAGEVARILDVDLDHLRDPRSLTSRAVERDGRSLTLPAFLVDGEEVWGATAMVLSEFLALIETPEARQ